MTVTTDVRTLTDRHAVVTGASRGIGAAIAEALAREGASLTLMGRDVAALSQRAAALTARHHVRALPVACDVSDADAVARAFDASREALGDAHVLVANAGEAASATAGDTSRALWDRMLAVNLTGAFLCVQAVLPAMRAARFGRVVLVSSTSALKGYPRTAAYAAAKAGLLGLARALAAEVARDGVTVNAVCPGYTETDMARAAIDNLVAAGRTPEEARRALERLNPRHALVTPEEVAATVVWLCAPSSGAITGQAVAVAAGEVM
ncbi:SDR family NAD(P)-dependent oxidoreductase [Roseisolibacter agri]|uniref:3-hydroxyacyl-CoA dehydrogenase n=1 Tax=Roseisolibacter agri TaxID=2014610 RepID=A0AA37V2F9_9BACT|nr:SDR family oxidoreductase [Roseisolibacter agri]GLC25212.1 3-hydroxyacyl-CoA dehydrogenase [Roseisolibacter agri]